MPSTGSNRSLATSLLIAAVVTQAAVSAEALDGIAPKERVLHFPPDRSLGMLIVQDAGIGGPTLDSHSGLNWEYLGDAMGDVTVPAGKRLHLTVDKVTVKNLPALSELKPDDLYALSIIGYDTSEVHGGAKPDDRCMQHLRNLTGLRLLILGETNITQKGLQFIADNPSLKGLKIFGPSRMGDAGLAQLAKLKSLEELQVFGCPDITHVGLGHLSHLPLLRDVQIVVEGPKIRGPGLAQLANIPSLRSLDLTGSKGIGDSELKYFEKATSLRTLNLMDVPITGPGLAHLSNLTGLEELNLHGTPVSDEGLAHLKPMRSLRKLDIADPPGKPTRITDAGMAHVGQIKSLESLILPSSITDKGLAELAELSHLKTLDARNSLGISDEGLKHLARLQSLETLYLRGNGITDAGMTYIARLGHLQDLMLGCSKDDPITDAGLAKLATLKSLKSFSIGSPRITISGLSCVNAISGLTALAVDPVVQDNTTLNIAGLTKLERLRMSTTPRSGTAIRDEDLACLAKLTHLKNFAIGQSPLHTKAISDKGMAYLAGLTELETLWIGGPGITDKGLSCLANMDRLTDVNITGSFTEQGLRHFEGRKHLRRLRLYSANDLNPEAAEHLRKTLSPLLDHFEVKKSEEIKKRPKAGNVAPPFSLKTLDGKEIALKDYRGKVVLLYFWATWCSPCVASAPALKELHQDLSRRDDFAMISLSMDENESKVRSFVEKHGLSWPQVCLGDHSKVAGDYGVTGAPAYFVIGPEGKIVSTDVSWQKLHEAITKALGPSAN